MVWYSCMATMRSEPRYNFSTWQHYTRDIGDFGRVQKERSHCDMSRWGEHNTTVEPSHTMSLHNGDWRFYLMACVMTHLTNNLL